METVVERMVRYLQYRDILPSSFERTKGWGTGYFRRTKNPGIDKVTYFLNEFPQLRTDWLLHGIGDMENTPSSVIAAESEVAENMARVSTTKGQPYFNVDFQGGFDLIMNSQTVNPDYLIDFAPYNKEGVMWCNAIGYSMEPEIKNGSIIAIREVKDWQEFIPFGEIYAIVTKNEQRMIKRIRKGLNDESYTLISSNEDYEPQIIKKSVITHVFAVIGTMQRLT